MSEVDSQRRIALRHSLWYEDGTPLEHIKVADLGRKISRTSFFTRKIQQDGHSD